MSDTKLPAPLIQAAAHALFYCTGRREDHPGSEATDRGKHMTPIRRYYLSTDGVMIGDQEGDYVTYQAHEQQLRLMADALMTATKALELVLGGYRDTQQCANAHVRGLSALRLSGITTTDHGAAPGDGDGR